MEKQCFKCGEKKSISEFYTHPEMADGHLGKCKTCTKRDTRERVSHLRTNPEWVMEQRRIGRERARRNWANGKREKRDSSINKNWRIRNRLKQKVHNIAEKALERGQIKRKQNCENCGTTNRRLEMHHEDYNFPLIVQWLCPSCHGLTKRKPAPTI